MTKVTPTSSSRRPVRIGVTGGIGAGKTAALEAFARAGAVPFSADEAVHRLYRTDEVRDAVRERWGDEVISDGEVDRAAVARIVFADPDELAWLEAFLHPLVGREWLRFLDEQDSRDDPPPAVVAEVPLLFEAGLEERYDHIVAVVAPYELRLQRVGERASGGDDDARQRAARQMREPEKLERAGFGYVNDGTLDELAAFVAEVMEQVT